MPSEILTVEELQQYLKIPRPTIYTLAQQGRIPAAKVGRHWRFKKSSINQWLREQQRTRAVTSTATRAAERVAYAPAQAGGGTDGHE